MTVTMLILGFVLGYTMAMKNVLLKMVYSERAEFTCPVCSGTDNFPAVLGVYYRTECKHCKSCFDTKKRFFSHRYKVIRQVESFYRERPKGVK